MPYEIIIVDNGSTDGTAAYLKSLAHPFKIIHNHTNLGFAIACNQGIRAATAPYILFLNNDTEPQPGWLEPLVEILDNDPSVAAAGSKLLFPNLTIQHAGVVIGLQEDSGQICPFHIFYKEKGSLTAANKVMEFAVCTGACLIVRAERLHELGGFDENFWNGYEDVDLCLRLRQGGWRVVYQPQSVLIHYESQSGPERFSRNNQNIELLQRKWRNQIAADILIKSNGKILPLESTGIRSYSADRRLQNCQRAPESQAGKRLPLPCVSGLISIVILTFNQLKFTKECVQSVREHTSEPHEIIFVDNGSSDGTVKWLRKLVGKNPNYQLIENKKNLGFSKGCNQGIEASSGEYIVLLNNDVVVTANWLGGMLECLTHGPDIGIVGPMTNNISGPQKVLSVNYSAIHELDEYSQTFRTKNRHRRIPNRRVVGFCMLFRRQLLEEIGLLDEIFGSGNFEDDDLCLRASLAGYRNMIAGDVFIHHYGNRTFIGNGIDYGSSMSGNRRIFIEKWGEKDVAQRFGVKLVVEDAMARSEEYFEKGDIEKATACLLGALNQAPSERSLYFKLAEMLADENRYQDAVDILEALQLNGANPRQAALLGYCAEALGRDDKAREYSERVLASDLRSAQATNILGVLAFKKGEKEVAEEYFREAIEFDPGFGESYTNLGSLKWAAGKTEEALQLFEQGFILSPTINDVAAAYHTAIVETKSFEKAEAVFREARALHPNHKRIAFLLIAVLLQHEKHESAMQEIEKAMMQFGIDNGMLSAGLEVRKRIGALQIEESKSRRAMVSLCMIVKNEESHLAKCLMSVKPVVDEMIVVDTGSSDRTKTIATVLGATVFDYPWTNDFSEARNYSLSKATGDWVLVLDADECLASKDHDRLLKLLKNDAKRRFAYALTTRNYCRQPSLRGWTANDGEYHGIESGDGWVPSTKVRLFPNHKGISFLGAVHELVEPTLQGAGIQMQDCDVPVHHYGKMDPAKTLAKGADYYRLGLKKIEETNGGYQALKELAVQASELEEYGEAVKIWQKVLELNPNDAVASMNAGYAHFKVENYEAAHDLSKKALELDPQLREAALNLSGCELMLGNVARAITLLEGILAKEPDYPPAMGRIAAAYILGARQKDGLEYLRRLRQRGYNCSVLIEDQAQALFSLGKTHEASLLMEALPNISGSARESLPAEIGSAATPDVRPVPKAAQGALSTTPRHQAAQLYSGSC